MDQGIQYLPDGCNTAIELKGSEENLSFSLPPELRRGCGQV